ncbi:MAG: universal stress protein [Thermodesulfobacteriota bacterium]
MESFSRILFPVDLSASSPKVAPFVSMMVRRFDAELHLVFVARELSHFRGINVPFPVIANLEEALVKGAEGGLEKFRDKYFPSLSNVFVSVLSGDIAEKIVAYACEKEADLIIMGTHGRKGLERIVLGSVAERVVKAAPMPVLVINPHKVKQENKGL